MPVSFGYRATAEDDLTGYGPWPESIEKPFGLVRYAPTRWTQSIYVLNGSDRIDKVSRTNLALKWQQSGGMEGIHGWRSDLYRFVPRPTKEWEGNIGVLNSSGFIQQNRGNLRSYPSGTIFMDVLSKDGIVFEHRERRKVNGRWTSKILYNDHAARPAGYIGLKQSCASCHDNEPGSGSYGADLVSGGDGNFSDPFQAR